MDTQLSVKSKTEQILKDNLAYTMFAWSKHAGLNPINVKEAKGVYLYDRSGKRYLDFSSQLMNVNIGHGHPAVLEAVARQMKELSYVTPTMITKVRGDLGKKLAEITPGNLTRTFFTLGGTDAIESAIMLARVYTGKHKIIAHYRSYHGATTGSLSASGDPRRLPLDSQQMPNVVHVENPYFYRCPWHTDSPEACGDMAIRNMEQIIQYEGPENIAAILIEGESGSSGCIKYPPFYWKKVKDLADKYCLLTIDDEILSGFGRTGKWFGIDHHGVAPDIMCMAKGITSGYIPLGAMIVSEAIASHFDDRVLPLGLTYSAHAVSCAAGLAVIDVYEKEGLIEKATDTGKYIDTCVAQLTDQHPSIGDWRNTGMLGCLELVKNRETKEPVAPFNAKSSEMGVMTDVALKIRELGMFTFVRWNTIYIVPPLISERIHIDEGIEIISKALTLADNVCTN